MQSNESNEDYPISKKYSEIIEDKEEVFLVRRDIVFFKLKRQLDEADTFRLILKGSLRISYISLLLALVQVILVFGLSLVSFDLAFVRSNYFAFIKINDLNPIIFSTLFMVFLSWLYFAYVNLKNANHRYDRLIRILTRINKLRCSIRNLLHEIEYDRNYQSDKKRDRYFDIYKSDI